MLLERLGRELLFFDGGMGTSLQAEGLRSGELPEIWNIEKAEVVRKIHQTYFEAGSDIVLANTFGANALKFCDKNYSLKTIVEAAVANARYGALKGIKDGREYYVALDVGPTGKLLEPMGDISFEEAYNTFKEVVMYGEEAGVDLIHIETMTDTYELKAAVLAAKENTNLPVFATVVFDENGRLLTGGDVPSVVAILEGLRVDALGINCGMGPEQMVPLLRKILEYTSLPVIVKPNAGIPKQRDGQTHYDVTPDIFAKHLREIVKSGACVIGGCCGTTPQHIKAMIEACKELPIIPPSYKNRTIVSSYQKTVELGEMPVIIGECINPTGKSELEQALKEADVDYIIEEGFAQQEQGAHILDINIGIPDIDEAAMMKEVITELQSVISLPLQIDTVNIEALEQAMRIYNGKPMVNSVSGKQESMDQVFPLIQKYGGVVVGLTLDEKGIPKTAEERALIAGKIINEAGKYGIDRKDIVIDVLTMPISSEPDGTKTTLAALKMVQEMYGVKTVLGVSNISFGLPNRPIINAGFYTMAMQNGLAAGMVNPSSEEVMNAYYAYCALMNCDADFETYIGKFRNFKKDLLCQ